MLTRIEIDGFKTFEDFSLDLGPFAVILGPNAAGKSNLFDALRLLSLLAGNDLRTSVKGMRGEPQELFRCKATGMPESSMRFAVELLLEPEVRDPWGETVTVKHSRARYEVEIERRRDERGIERLVVAREEARPILSGDDAWHPGGREPSAAFKRSYMHYARRTPWLHTDSDKGKPTFRIMQDGRQGRSHSAEAAEATVLSSITSAEFPHLFAMREEMRSWRFLQLDPSALRRPSATTAADELEPDGANLATVLARIQAETVSKVRPRGALSDIAADLAAMIPGVQDLGVEEDVLNSEYRITIGMWDGSFSSRVVSDGTLRVLGLLTLLHDPKHHGLVCFEEPENGVHPLRLRALLGRLRELVSDPSATDISPGEPLSQMLMNSHSPVVLSALDQGEMLFADLVSVIDPGQGLRSRRTRIRLVRGTDQVELLPDDSAYVTRFTVDHYLSSVEVAV